MTQRYQSYFGRIKKSEYVEIAMGEAVQKVDDLEKISQETAKTAKTAQTAAGLAKVSAERTQRMINLQNHPHCNERRQD
ncbi:phage protein [Streptococcus pyogenes]|nr:phage protein [Streptococcus pyogenes]